MSIGRYCRTETNIFPKDFNLAQLVALQTGDTQWGGKDQLLILFRKYGTAWTWSVLRQMYRYCDSWGVGGCQPVRERNMGRA